MGIEDEMEARVQAFLVESANNANHASSYEKEVTEAMEHLEEIGRELAHWLIKRGIHPHQPATTGTERTSKVEHIRNGKWSPGKWRRMQELTDETKVDWITERDIPATWSVPLPGVMTNDDDALVETIVTLSTTGVLGETYSKEIGSPKKIKRRYFEQRAKQYFGRYPHDVRKSSNFPRGHYVNFVGQVWVVELSPDSGKRELRLNWGDRITLSESLKSGVLRLATSK